MSPGYRLNVADTDVDLGRFIRLRAAGVENAAAGRFDDAVRHFTAALDEWRGNCLADLREFEFVELFATSLIEDKVATQTARAEAEMACGRAETVIKELEGLVVEHPYREPVWAQLMTAYYLADRQSDALDAYQRLKSVLADDLGIDPNDTLRALHERILRQEPLDIKQSSRTTAAETMVSMVQRRPVGAGTSGARLRAASGECYPVAGTATRIGRLSENDVVLADGRVSRYHAVIIDTGTSYVINDVGSANGVELERQRIRGSAALADGDHIRIGDSEFVFELQATGPNVAGG
jgi:pSer/pThr/pTyr-binding forkhead associated (FHA) protein